MSAPTPTTKPRSSMNVATRWTISALSAVAVVAISAAGLFASGAIPVADTLTSASPAARQVSQTLLTSYCPSEIGLADQQSYGDSEFAASQGDLSSATRFAALGAVYGSSVGSIQGKKSADLKMGDTSLALGTKSSQGSSILSSTLLSSEDGTGDAAAVASWASKGDVQGLASTSCVRSSLTSSFLVPTTTTGNSNILVVANTSDKPTTVNVAMWGTKSNQKIASSTDSTLTVAAHSEKSFDISAAAPDQSGVFVSVSSQVVPVFSVVKATSANGLTSRGVDYVAPLAQQSGTSVLAGFSKGQKVTLRAYSAKDQTVSLSWIAKSGTSAQSSATLNAHQVATIDAGSVPKDATALQVTSSSGVYLSAAATVGGADQSDFSVVNPTIPQTHSALTVPDGVDASLVIANASARDQSVTLEGTNGSGTLKVTKKVTVPARSSVTLALSDVSNAASVSLAAGEDAQISWAALVSVKALTKAHVAQAGVIASVSLMPQKTTVAAERSTLVSAR